MKKTYLVAALTAGALMLAGCGNGVAKTEVLKTADGKVTEADVAAYIGIMEAQYSQMGSEIDYESIKNYVTDSMETTYKDAELAKAMGIEYTDEDRNSALMSRASIAAAGGGYSKFEEYMKDAGSSVEFMDNYCKAEIYAQKLRSDEKYTAAMDEITIDDAAIKEKFNSYYYAKHILIPETDPDASATGEPAAEETATEAATEAPAEKAYGEEFANQLLERAKNGEDFNAMMTQYSTDPGLESNPDGYVFTDGEMMKEFEECVKGLKPGEFGICKTTYGYHIISRLELNESTPKYNEMLEEKKSSIEDDLKTEELYKKNNINISMNKDVLNGLKEDQIPTFELKTQSSM